MHVCAQTYVCTYALVQTPRISKEVIYQRGVESYDAQSVAIGSLHVSGSPGYFFPVRVCTFHGTQHHPGLCKQRAVEIFSWF